MKRKWYVNILLIILFVGIYFLSNALSSMFGGYLSTLVGGDYNIRLMQFSLLGDFIPILVMIGFCKYILKWDLSKLWLKDPNKVKNYSKGYIVGIILFCSFIVISLITKNIQYSGINNTSVFDILIFLPGYALQSFEEEVLSRGILQRIFKDKFGILPSILIPSAIFSALHLGNSGMNIGGTISVFLVGILFALMVYKTKSIWYAGAAHGAWNYFQGTIFGQSVSGDTATTSLLKFQTTGTNELFTGGAFGPEASIFVIGILCIGIVYYYLSIRKNMSLKSSLNK